MLHQKLITEEQSGTYLISEPVSESKLLRIANQR